MNRDREDLSDIETVEANLETALDVLQHVAKQHADPALDIPRHSFTLDRLVLRQFPSPHPANNGQGSWQVIALPFDPSAPLSWTYLSTQDAILLLADHLATGGRSCGAGIPIPDIDTGEYKTAEEQWQLERSLEEFGGPPHVPGTTWGCNNRHGGCFQEFDPSDPAQRAHHDDPDHAD